VSLHANSHLRRDSTVELSRVSVVGVNWQSITDGAVAQSLCSMNVQLLFATFYVCSVILVYYVEVVVNF